MTDSSPSPAAERPAQGGWSARAWSLVVVGYLLAFGFSSVVAVGILVGSPVEIDLPRPAALIVASSTFALGFAVAPLAHLLAHRWLRLSGTELGLRGETLWRAVGAAGAAYLAMKLGFETLFLFPEWPTPHAAAEPWQVLLTEVHGGVVEELLILALPMAVMTRLGWGWPAQLLVLVVLRTPFHLYYGPQALALTAVWMAGFLLVYRQVPLVWSFMAAHLVYNLANSPFIPVLIRVGASFALTVIGVVAVVRWISAQRRRRRTGPLPGSRA
ncbi:MFS family permease [Nocardiopsis mwathae]|uniref:MFS family permease n=1 Tax=Nocardiopsis mwathae TaxID=1472723 RepID=A0A7X0D7S6_9ACTN|nr:CPBP family glutamic-type intramembrane protease [Nocardiopsis mwathae]MBB6174051.1 MFS family permease [Nocardiopsis mwathae]